MPPDPDAAHLWDMLDAANTLMSLTQGENFEEFLSNVQIRLSSERLLEIIGEAARRVSDPYRQAHPEIPWQEIIGLRNVISHQYDGLDYRQLWSIVMQDVPKLVVALAPLVPPASKA